MLDELEIAFSDLVYPGDEELGESRPNEWETTYERLYGKDWREVTFDDFEADGGLLEAVNVLSSQGFIYFLPGLLRIALMNSDFRYITAYAISNEFSVPDYLVESGTEEIRRRIDRLNQVQRDFLIRFFTWTRKEEPDLCPVLIDSAIKNLTTGEITAYRQRSVEESARQASKEIAPAEQDGAQ